MRASPDLTAAFAVIRKYAPGTYAAMQRSRWIVSTRLADMPRGYQRDLETDPRTEMATGVTNSTYGVPATWINAPLISEEASETRLSRVTWTAAIMVHEFVHTDQPGDESADSELPAFAAELAFARLIPGNGRMIRAVERDRDAEVKWVSDMFG